MTATAKQLAILNLAGELSSELANYFAQKQVLVVDPAVDATKEEWTHILTRNVDDFNFIKETYKTFEKEIKVISLSDVKSARNFIFANGKMIFDERWMDSAVGVFILDKFFQEYAGISLSDNYPKFAEKGSFNLMNPFNTGEYTDRMVHEAFDHGVAALSVKTYFDHLNMYLAGLKKKGKVGYPIEVSYGVFDDVFGVQVHFYSEGLIMEDVTGSLSPNISRHTEENLLHISVQSTDFFDFTFLAAVKKVVITGVWTKTESIAAANRGLMLVNLLSAASVAGLESEDITSNLLPSEEPADNTEKVALPKGELPEERIKISGDEFTESIAESISSSLEIDNIRQIISGTPENDEETLVSGNFETEDGKTSIAPDKAEKDILNVIKGQIEEEKAVFKLGGDKFSADNFAMRIAAGVANAPQGKGMMQVKSLGEKLPDTLKSGLFAFASKLGKNVDELSVDDLENFQTNEVPKIVKGHLTSSRRAAEEDNIQLIADQFEEELKVFSITEQKLNPDDFAMRVAAGVTSRAQGANMMKVKSIGEALPVSIKTGLYDFAKGLNKNADELTSADLAKFQQTELSEIIKNQLVIENQKSTTGKDVGLLNDIRGKLEKKLKKEFKQDSIETILDEATSVGDQLRVKGVVKSSLKESMDSQFQLSHKESISKDEQEKLVKSLSSSLGEDEEKIRKIVVAETAPSSNSLFQAPAVDPQVAKKLERVDKENALLKENLKTVMSELKVLKESKTQINGIASRAEEEAKKIVIESKFDAQDEQLRNELQERLAKKQSISIDEQAKFADLMEREKQLLQQAKEEEKKAKRAQIESGQREQLFIQELEKANRQIRSKDLMLEKTKEALQKTIAKKDFDTNELKTRIDQLNREKATSPVHTQALTIKELEKQNNGLTKMLEMAKSKINALNANLQAKSDDGSAKEEARRLTLMNTQFKNQYEAAKRDVSKLMEKLNAEAATANNLRQEIKDLEALVKKTNIDAGKTLPTAANPDLELSLKRSQAQNALMENQLKEISNKLRDTETKFAEFLKNQKASTNLADESRSKTAQLEANVKKLTADLLDSRNQLGELKKEANKLRQEKTALQNQVDKFKKDTEKAKGNTKKSA